MYTCTKEFCYVDQSNVPPVFNVLYLQFQPEVQPDCNGHGTWDQGTESCLCTTGYCGQKCDSACTTTEVVTAASTEPTTTAGICIVYNCSMWQSSVFQIRVYDERCKCLTWQGWPLPWVASVYIYGGVYGNLDGGNVDVRWCLYTMLYRIYTRSM